MALAADRLSYRYPGSEALALTDVACEFPAGAFTLIAGRNGAGKSTLLAALAGFMPRFFGGELRGEVRCQGRLLHATPFEVWLRSVSLVLAEPAAQLSHARDTVFDEIAFGAENLGMPPSEIAARVREVLEQLSLAPLADRSPLQLSGGEQQRVAIASVLVLGSRALLLDEPTSHLDPQGAKQVMALLGELKRHGCAVGLATHRLDEAALVADGAVLLEQGRVGLSGRAAAVLTSPLLEASGVRAPLELRLKHPLPPPVEVGAIPPVSACSVRFRNVGYRYPSGVEALAGVALELTPGSLTALVGANGSGKSTLCRLPGGLLRPSSGEVLVGDWDAAACKPWQLARRVGTLLQNPADQLFARSVQDEVAFGPQQLGVGGEALIARVERALELCALVGREEEHPFDLSASERQWLALASLLAMETPVLVLDEPGSGFDDEQLRRLQTLLIGLKAAGRTLLLVSHDLQLVAEVADEVMVLQRGRVLAHGPCERVLRERTLLQEAGLDAPPALELAERLGLGALLRESELRAAIARRDGASRGFQPKM